MRVSYSSFSDKIIKFYYNNKIKKMNSYDYDFFVIGGGSGGLSASKQAASLGKKVALADYVKPTPIGTKWGLGGTCVNVGCIPKKMMHHAGSMYESLSEFEKIGYPEKIPKKHDWETMVRNVQNYIKKLNFGYKFGLKKENVTYFNKLAKLIDEHTIELTDHTGKTQTVTSDKILVAVGGRPNYLDCEGAKELCITSDDVFSLKKAPGKTLVVGASYIALECGGFLNALGYETAVMVRSILLRGFDQQMANRIGTYMSNQGVRFIRESIPTKFTKTDSGRILVEYQSGDNQKHTEEYDTVLLAIGRLADTKNIGLEKVGVKLAKNGKIIVSDDEKSNIENIFAIGDCAEGRPELTPPAIMAGKLLANRLFGGTPNKNLDYKNIATTVFTPIEYGCVGFTEDEAIAKWGKDDVKTYHSEFRPLEWNFDLEREDNSYLKVVTVKSQNEKVVGFHILSPHAGEITQGVALAIKMGVTKAHLDSCVGIHPTIAEEFTTLKFTTDESGQKEGC